MLTLAGVAVKTILVSSCSLRPLIVVTTPNAFLYELPHERIAQRPVYPYDKAKLLTCHRSDATLSDRSFSDLSMLLGPGDVLVFNNSKVIQARLLGTFLETKKNIEVLLLEESEKGIWKALGKPLKKFKPGSVISFSDEVSATVIERVGDYEVLLNFKASKSADILHSGTMPIPPYIRDGKGDEADLKDYQSTFAKFSGSVAAPTASLHFTPELISALEQRGVTIREVTLHVGPASFLPVVTNDNLGNTVLKEPGFERMEVTSQFFDALKKDKADGKRIIAIGTTVVRCLESLFSDHYDFNRSDNKTDLFITPGYKFQCIDALITNFHQPGSSHLLLVEAFMRSKSFMQSVYQHALSSQYRFLSYGDGMFILP